MIQQERSMKETKTSTTIFSKDLELVKNFIEHQNLERKKGDLVPLTRADALRICIEFANAHGVFS